MKLKDFSEMYYQNLCELFAEKHKKDFKRFVVEQYNIEKVKK
jgi:hypothetical protein